MRRHAIERLLPTVYQVTASESGPLDGVLAAMEQLHAPDEAILARIEDYFDPYRAPVRFVPYLARWVDLGWLVDGASFDDGIGRLRNLIAIAPELSRRRGTAAGMIRFLETATGVEGFAVDDAPFHVTVTAPAEARRLRGMIDLIVRTERPAHATYDIGFAEADGEPATAEPAPSGAGGQE